RRNQFLPSKLTPAAFNKGDPRMSNPNQNPGQQTQNPNQKPGQQGGGQPKPGQQQQGGQPKPGQQQPNR
ncbi:MAG TPA: hypothetical protein VIH63_06010, partial [Xanthobacteraceae bacterium]